MDFLLILHPPNYNFAYATVPHMSITPIETHSDGNHMGTSKWSVHIRVLIIVPTCATRGNVSLSV